MKPFLRIFIFIAIAVILNAVVYLMADHYYDDALAPEAQSDQCLFWASMSFLSVPVGIVLVIFGLAWGALKSWLPFAVCLASAVAINAILAVAMMMDFDAALGDLMRKVSGNEAVDTEAWSWLWFLFTGTIGLLLIAIGLLWSLKDNIFVLTFLRLSCASLFALTVTVFFPFIVLAAGLYLKKKRGLRFREVWSQGPYLYNFFIINVYPIFFQILPGLRLMLRKGRQEKKMLKKKYRKEKRPVFESSLDLDKLQIGDVILTGKDSWAYSVPIQTTNLLSNGESHRYWTHAAIYSGDGKVIEAQADGRGVTETVLADFFFKKAYKLMAIRPKYLSTVERDKVVEYCRDKQTSDCAYDTWGAGFYAIASLVPPMLSGWLESEFAEKFFNVGNAYFCSELIAEAFQENGHDIFNRKPWRVKPLDFAFNPMFQNGRMRIHAFRGRGSTSHQPSCRSVRGLSKEQKRRKRLLNPDEFLNLRIFPLHVAQGTRTPAVARS